VEVKNIANFDQKRVVFIHFCIVFAYHLQRWLP
jgi:hypothetical protein